ncbi:MAG: acyltransferase [Planctomycetes bacterium]|nr:acyltransferase [Planctomycetota bacterium]
MAILLVLLAHMRFRLFSAGGLYPQATLEAICEQGVIGVPIFFGISGLLICSRLLEERRLRGEIDLRGFYLRRVFRILPPYFLLLATIAGLGAYQGVRIAWSDLQACLGFYRNYIPGENAASWYTAHFWSLAVEEHFYVLLPTLLVACVTARRTAYALLGIAFAVITWRAMANRFTFVSPDFLFLTYRTDIRIDGLLLGALAALALEASVWRERCQRALTPIVVASGLLLLALAPWLRLPSLPTLTAVVVPLLLLGTLLYPSSRLGRLLELAPLRWIGRMSYSLYLWQQIFFTPIHQPLTDIPMPALLPDALLTWPGNLIGLLACATASYYVVERPLTRLGRRLAEPATEGRAP